MENIMMEVALKYAKANIPIMPLHWIREDGSCSCRKGQKCDSKEKHPIYSGWYKNSTTDTQQITRWWTIKPNANIGIPTGEKSGLLVLDVDDGGGETLAELEATNENYRVLLLLLLVVVASTMYLSILRAETFRIK